MMVKVLVYGYATGVFSSRAMARKLEEDVAFRVLGAGNFPSHRMLCEFRRRHLEDFKGLFVEVVREEQGIDGYVAPGREEEKTVRRARNGLPPAPEVAMACVFRSS